MLAVAAAIFWIGFDGGSYDAISRGTLAITVWWIVAVAVGLGLWPRARIPAAALAAGGLLTGYIAWIGLSALWDESAERTLTELNRTSLYLGVFALAVLASDRLRLPAILTGLSVGLTGIGLLALGSRLFPGLSESSAQVAQIFPSAEKRLSYPVNYWNGLATLVAFSFPLLLHFATSARSVLVRGLVLLPVPALAGTVYLTSSRGGTVAALLATVAFGVLAPRRWAAAGAILVGGAGAALAVAALSARSELVDRPFGSALAESQGRSAALLLALICLGTGIVWAFAARFAPAPPRLARPLQAGLLLAVLAVAGIGIALSAPAERFERFKEIPPPELGEASVEEHLFSGSGNGRWQLWQAAVDEWEREPLLGRSAGTYEATWAEHSTLPLFVRDAHSLYLETLAELGVVGLLLLGGALATGFVAAGSRIFRTVGEERSALAALAAFLAAYVFEAGFDWMWELTAVSAVAAGALGLLVGPATRPEPPLPPPRGAPFRAVVVLAAVAALALQVVPFLAELKVEDSRAAAAAGDLDDAVNDARAAATLTSWAASPRTQVALAEELAGRTESAQASIEEALERDPFDWRLWLVAARIQTKAGQFEAARASLERAEELNPRSQLFAN
jgi:tetratricopeptide (TPR) repeat protein